MCSFHISNQRKGFHCLPLYIKIAYFTTNKTLARRKAFLGTFTLCKTSLYDMERIIYWVVSKKREGRSPFCEVTPKIVRCGLLMGFFEVFFTVPQSNMRSHCFASSSCCCLFLLIYLQKNSKLFQFFTTESNIRKLMFFY